MKKNIFLTEKSSNINKGQYYFKNFKIEQVNPSINKQKNKNKNNHTTSINLRNPQNKENNFSQILKILDDEVKKSNKYKLEINSLKNTINNKNKEIIILNQNLLKINQEKNDLYKLNNTFYKSVVETMNNLKQTNDGIIKNINYPKYSSLDEIKKGNDTIISMIKLLIEIIKDLCKNTSNNISKYKQLKNKMNLVNESFEENNKEKIFEINLLKKKNYKLKNILEQNIIYLKQLRGENTILKKRNLKLEKNINLLSESSDNLRKKNYMPIRIKFNNNNKDEMTNDININNISLSTNMMNKTSTDILIDEFHEKDNKIKSLHNYVKKIYNYNKKNTK